jgi:hypothetical protein
MKRTSLALVLALLLVSILAPAAAAQTVPPTQCAVGFELHETMDHEHHEHHIGLKTDLNGDGYLCVKHLNNGLHVHVDNVIP